MADPISSINTSTPSRVSQTQYAPTTTGTPTTPTQRPTAYVKTLVSLNQTSSFGLDAAKQQELSNSFLNTFGTDENKTASALENMPEGRRNNVLSAGASLAQKIQEEYGASGSEVTYPAHAPSQQLIAAFKAVDDTTDVAGVTAVSPSNSNSDNTAVPSTDGIQSSGNRIMGLLHYAVAGTEAELGNFAKYVQGNIEHTNDLRTGIKDVNETLAAWPANATPETTQKFSWQERNNDGTFSKHENEDLTKPQAQSLKENLQMQLDTMRTMNEMDNLKMQDIFQNVQKLYQTLSNILKVGFDTDKAIIGNLRV